MRRFIVGRVGRGQSMRNRPALSRTKTFSVYTTIARVSSRLTQKTINLWE